MIGRNIGATDLFLWLKSTPVSKVHYLYVKPFFKYSYRIKLRLNRHYFIIAGLLHVCIVLLLLKGKVFFQIHNLLVSNSEWLKLFSPLDVDVVLLTLILLIWLCLYMFGCDLLRTT